MYAKCLALKKCACMSRHSSGRKRIIRCSSSWSLHSESLVLASTHYGEKSRTTLAFILGTSTAIVVKRNQELLNTHQIWLSQSQNRLNNIRQHPVRNKTNQPNKALRKIVLGAISWATSALRNTKSKAALTFSSRLNQSSRNVKKMKILLKHSSHY